ncbi:hypothetical protein [Nonomuraea rubra]|uniref:Uncharacterized protein n=1 Tax=Nonomuraea rubra TaxID=46180 RepID=A0A7X0U5R1_9ACTN|nr:hypothetical protein [Nonomuraea rubra]MBB6556123.1 hypothetical protein [Nonomuraea rubra]
MDDPEIVRWHDGRDVYVYPNGDRFYVDEIEAMRAGAEERRNQPLKVDSIEDIGRMYLEARAKAANPPLISRNVAVLLGIPLDDPDVEQPSNAHSEG